MLEAAVDGVDHFEVDRRELQREGPTYTWDTIETFRPDEVMLVLGADAAAGVDTWYRGQDLISSVPIAVAHRPGTTRDVVEAVLPAFRWLEMPSLDISSTELRAWLRRGFSGRFLIPDTVLDVIAAAGLYRA